MPLKCLFYLKIESKVNPFTAVSTGHSTDLHPETEEHAQYLGQGKAVFIPQGGQAWQLLSPLIHQGISAKFSCTKSIITAKGT